MGLRLREPPFFDTSVTVGCRRTGARSRPAPDSPAGSGVEVANRRSVTDSGLPSRLPTAVRWGRLPVPGVGHGTQVAGDPAGRGENGPSIRLDRPPCRSG